MKFQACSTTRERVELVKHMLSELENPSKPLTAWENSFIESCSDQFMRKGSLSERQVEILENIYAEKTA